MKQLFVILTKFLQLLGELSVVLVKFLVFLILSPITLARCVPRAWRHKSFKVGREKFSWIWGAYWKNFNL